MGTWIARGILSLLLAVLLVAGCASEEQKAERERQQLPVKVRQFLAEGDLAYKQGNFLAALALSDSAEHYAPDLADIHFFRGRVYTDLNRLDIANAAYRAALEADPKHRGAHMNLGVNLVRRGKLRDALGQFKQEEALAPNSDLYLEMGRAYVKLGEPDSARTAYEQAIALDSTNATAFMWLGQLYEETGDFENALAYSRRGLALRPDNLDYQYIIGSQLFRTGKVEEAVAYLQPVAEQRAWHHGAQYNLGQALMRLGREEEAQRYLQRADTAQQLQQAVNEAQDVISRDPETLANWISLGEALRKAGMYDRAVAALKVAVTMEPGNLALQTNLATLILESGDAEGAIQHYQAIVARDSTLVDTWLNLGVAYGNSGRYEEARHAWERVLQQAPGHRTAKTYLAKLATLSSTP